MSGLFLHSGPLGRYYYFEEQIAERVRQNRADYLAILPVNRAARLFKRRLLEYAGSRALPDPPVFTFDELLLSLYRFSPEARRVISPDMLQAIIEKILYEHPGEFPYFMPEQRPSGGLVKKVSEMIGELRRFGYDARVFREKPASEKEANPLKYTDFLNLLELLDRQLGKQLIDETFARHCAAEQFTLELLRKILPQTQTVFISGYGLFTPAMHLFIDKARQVLDVHIKLEYLAENSSLFAHTAEAYQRFSAMPAQLIVTPPTRLAANLFNRRAMPAVDGDYSRFTIQAVNQRRDEVAFMAAQIRRLHLEEEIPLYRIAVTFSDLERYAPLIRRIFPEYGLPFNLSTGFRLSQSTLVRQLLAVLSLIEGGYETTGVIRFMQSALVKKYDDFNPALLSNAFVKSRLRRLLPGWPDKVRRALRLDASRGEEIPEVDGKTAYKNAEYQITQLSGWLEKFYAFPRQATVTRFRDAYIRLLSETGLLQWYHHESNALSERQREAEFRAYNRFMKQFDRMIWTLHYLYADTPISLAEFTRNMRSFIGDSLFSLSEWPDYGVQIMPRLEVQALPVRILFIGGLTDGVFPRTSTHDIFFRDTARKDLGLLASEEFLPQDRFIFYTLLDARAEQIFLTFPRFEEDRALTPSTFLSDLAEAVPVDWRNEPPAADELINRSRLLLRMSGNIQFNRFKEAEALLETLLGLHDLDDREWLSLFSGMEISRRRLSPGAVTIYEGDLHGRDEIRNELNRRFDGQIWSVNRLEAYAFCPMSFFMQYILGLEETPQLEEGLTPLERGNVLHSILQRFYRTLKSKGQQANPLPHLDLLRSIARQALDELPYSGLFWELDRSLFFGSRRSRGLLETFAAYDQEQIEHSGFVPQFFELSFGQTGEGERDPASLGNPLTLQLDGAALKLSGRIDRIDFNTQSEALIFDYKTGRKESLADVRLIAEGLSFQLPLYLLALMEMQPAANPVMAAYYQVRDADNCKHFPAMIDSDRFPSKFKKARLPNPAITSADGQPLSFDGLAEHALRTALEKVGRLQTGYFTHTVHPDKPQCETYCPYRRMCQKNKAKLLAGRAETASAPA
jgi:ATP-dependent helicase/DNAse subunit B